MQRFRAQSLGEYTVMISLVVLAVMAMTYFIQRGFQARTNDARRYMMDELGPDIRSIHKARTGVDYNGTMEYEPYYVNKEGDTATDSLTNVHVHGPTSTYSMEKTESTGMNILSKELPPEDVY